MLKGTSIQEVDELHSAIILMYTSIDNNEVMIDDVHIQQKQTECLKLMREQGVSSRSRLAGTRRLGANGAPTDHICRLDPLHFTQALHASSQHSIRIPHIHGSGCHCLVQEVSHSRRDNLSHVTRHHETLFTGEH